MTLNVEINVDDVNALEQFDKDIATYHEELLKIKAEIEKMTRKFDGFQDSLQELRNGVNELLGPDTTAMQEAIQHLVAIVVLYPAVEFTYRGHPQIRRKIHQDLARYAGMLLKATETLCEHYTSAQQRTDQNHRRVVQLGTEVALAAKEVNDQYITDATRLMGEIHRQRELLGEWTKQATSAYFLLVQAENKKAQVKIDDADLEAILLGVFSLGFATNRGIDHSKAVEKAAQKAVEDAVKPLKDRVLRVSQQYSAANNTHETILQQIQDLKDLHAKFEKEQVQFRELEPAMVRATNQAHDLQEKVALLHQNAESFHDRHTYSTRHGLAYSLMGVLVSTLINENMKKYAWNTFKRLEPIAGGSEGQYKEWEDIIHNYQPPKLVSA